MKCSQLDSKANQLEKYIVGKNKKKQDRFSIYRSIVFSYYKVNQIDTIKRMDPRQYIVKVICYNDPSSRFKNQSLFLGKKFTSNSFMGGNNIRLPYVYNDKLNGRCWQCFTSNSFLNSETNDKYVQEYVLIICIKIRLLFPFLFYNDRK